LTKIDIKNLLKDKTCFNCLYNSYKYCGQNANPLPKIGTCEFWSTRVIYSKYVPVVENIKIDLSTYQKVHLKDSTIS